VAVAAQSIQGFNPSWLRDAVIGPLEEVDVEIEGGDNRLNATKLISVNTPDEASLTGRCTAGTPSSQ
jgi:hypothetical protein